MSSRRTQPSLLRLPAEDSTRSGRNACVLCSCVVSWLNCVLVPSGIVLGKKVKLCYGRTPRTTATRRHGPRWQWHGARRTRLSGDTVADGTWTVSGDSAEAARHPTQTWPVASVRDTHRQSPRPALRDPFPLRSRNTLAMGCARGVRGVRCPVRNSERSGACHVRAPNSHAQRCPIRARIFDHGRV